MNSEIDRTGCFGNTIKVAAGHYVDLVDPTPESIELRSISTALGKICRFGGHCPSFYSVAEHSVNAATFAAEDGYAGEALQAILLHDAAEAYLGDVVKPLKVLLPAYSEIEKKLEIVIGLAFGIDFTWWQDVIKRYDLITLKAEKLAMWPDDNHEWTGLEEIETRPLSISCLSPSAATNAFNALAAVVGLTNA